MEKQLYPWQEDCLDKWFLNRCRGMVQAVTGSGKTLLALTAAFRLEKRLGRPVQVKIVVPTSGLMFQWEKAIREYAALWKDERIPRTADTWSMWLILPGMSWPARFSWSFARGRLCF